MHITLLQAVKESQAKLLYQKEGSLVTLLGAASDNRSVKNGDLFICIKGNSVDGHDFAKDAMERGAHALLAERNPFEEEYGDNPPIPVLLVENSVKALGLLANSRRKAYAREDASHKVIGITGTAGKTSLKELLSYILSIDETIMDVLESSVAKNPLNHNTQIGMPIAILNASGNEKFWVLEMGISHAHDMDELGAIVEPDIAIILNAASGHTEGLGELGVPHHKARLLKYVQKNGMALVSKDYPDLVKEAQVYSSGEYNTKILYFTTKNDDADNTNTAGNNSNIHNDTNTAPILRGTYKGLNKNDCGEYSLFIEKEEFSVSSSFIGASGAENCIAAAAAAYFLGVSKKIITIGIETMPTPQMRFNRTQKGNWTIIDDSYNANPLSSMRMLESAQELAENKAFFVLMGEMKELGDLTQSEHILLGKSVAKSTAKIFFWVGDQIAHVEKGLIENNFAGKFIPVQSNDEFLAHVKENIHVLGMKENLILFKGSRSNYLENYVTLFVEQCDAL